MLEAKNVSVVRNNKTLLDNVSMVLEPGKLTAVVGPNGAGKSTLLRVFAGELKPSDGTATMDGHDIRGMQAVKLAARRAVVSQSTTLAFSFTVLEVVMLGATVPAFGISDPIAEAAAREALDAVGLSDFESRPLLQLSGGERQRVHIARALCQLQMAPRVDEQPVALLLDEPTASLDLKHQTSVLNVIRTQARNGRAVLLVIHDLNLASAFADEIVLMSAGRIAARGAPVDVLKEPILAAVFGCRLSVFLRGSEKRPLVLPANIGFEYSLETAAE